MNENKSCCIINIGKVEVTNELIGLIRESIRHLLDEDHIYTYYFTNRDKYTSLCLKILTEFKNGEYFGIERIYLPTKPDELYNQDKHFVYNNCEGVFFSKDCMPAGKADNLARNKVMIDKCDYCLFPNKSSPNDTYSPNTTNQTNLKLYQLYEYAILKNKNVVLLQSAEKPIDN